MESDVVPLINEELESFLFERGEAISQRKVVFGEEIWNLLDSELSALEEESQQNRNFTWLLSCKRAKPDNAIVRRYFFENVLVYRVVASRSLYFVLSSG